MRCSWLSRANIAARGTRLKRRPNFRKESDAMSTKTKTSMAMKIVAIVLILASAAMLFLPWMKVAVNYYGTTISGGDILRRAAEEEYGHISCNRLSKRY